MIVESAATGDPLRVDVNGEIFVLRVEPDDARKGDSIWAGYDPEEVSAALEKYAGAWADLDVDAMIENLYRAREEGTRPAHRPRPISKW